MSRAIGSADSEFRSGETDLRGIYIGRESPRHGRQSSPGKGRPVMPFYRGEQWLGEAEEQAENRSASQSESKKAQDKQKLDYQQNLRLDNGMIQRWNYDRYDQMRRGINKGVEGPTRPIKSPLFNQGADRNGRQVSQPLPVGLFRGHLLCCRSWSLLRFAPVATLVRLRGGSARKNPSTVVAP